MADKKVIFVAFAIEDERMRDMVKGQSLLTTSPFEYIDMSVKEAYESDWKDKVRTRIRRSHGLLALISKNSSTSTGQAWEIKCAQAEGIPILGIWIYTSDRTRPASMAGEKIEGWTWPTITQFIDNLVT